MDRRILGLSLLLATATICAGRKINMSLRNPHKISMQISRIA